MFELFIILIGFISLVIVGIWYDRIVPPIHRRFLKVFTSNRGGVEKRRRDSLTASTQKETEYRRIEDIDYPKPAKMTKYHVLYLITGAVFWGAIISLVGKLLIWPDISIKFLFGVCIILTSMVTLFVQERLGGFDVEEPKHWFFIPIGSWVLVILYAFIEALFLGEAPFFFEFFR